MATEEVYSAFLSKEVRTAFLHGHSYTANPIACAAAVESWKILDSPECKARVASISERTRRHIDALAKHPKVKSARSLGTIGVIELDLDLNYFNASSEGSVGSDTVGALMKRALERNVLLRPLGNVLPAVPPYCCTDQEIDRIYETMLQMLEG